MSVNVEIFDGRGRLTRKREIMPDKNYPFAYYHPQFGCKTNLPRIALIGCNENDMGGTIYTLELEEVEIKDRRIAVPSSALLGKEPTTFSMGGEYEITVATQQGDRGLLVARHAGEWADVGQGIYNAMSVN